MWLHQAEFSASYYQTTSSFFWDFTQHTFVTVVAGKRIDAIFIDQADPAA
jgi:hypothetical protein